MRKWFSLSIFVLLSLGLIVTVLVREVRQLLTDAHIDNVRFHIESLGLNHAGFTDFSFTYRAEQIQQTAELKNIFVDWNWHRLSPQINFVNIQRLDLSGEITPTPQESQEKPEPVFQLPQDWSIPKNFPRKIRIEHLAIRQPCWTGSCVFAGSADIVSPSSVMVIASVKASLGDSFDAQHQLVLAAAYKVENSLPRVDAQLGNNKGINLKLDTFLQKENDLNWTGHIQGSIAELDNDWLAYLQKWNVKIAPQKSDLGILNIDTSWKIALGPLLNRPLNSTVEVLKNLTGHWQLNADSPTLVNVYGLGDFFGKLNVDVAMTNGKLDRYTFLADLNARNFMLPQSFQVSNVNLDSLNLNVKSSGKQDVSLAALPIEITGSTLGMIQSTLKSNLLLDVLAKKITFNNFSIIGSSKKINAATYYELANIGFDVNVQGAIQSDTFILKLTTPAKISADINAKNISLSAKSTKLIAKNLDISGTIKNGEIAWQQLDIKADASLKIDKLSHPQLKANTWSWQGKAHGTSDNLALEGDLVLGTALNLNHHATLKTSELKLDWKIADLFLLAGNPFADTIKAWPPLLSFARGKFKASGDLLFNIEQAKLIDSQAEIKFEDVTGIYDTIAFEGLNSRALIDTTEKNINFSASEIKINQINKGFVMGPITAAGSYRASWLDPLKGKFILNGFNANAFGGTVTTSKQEFDFGHDSQHFTMAINQLNLATLLQQYPSSELSGTGQLSGNVPIEINSKGMRIVKGVVAADSSGGKLKYQSERADALAKSQPGVKLITEALSDFQYSILSSEVHYDETGKLLLSVRLEGKNPSLEKGRPINFNVNLEEDVPAMLASIQLSSKVTDVIKTRVQNYIKKNNSTTTN